MSPPYRILIAEDDQASLLVLQQVLEHGGYDARTVADGAKVAEEARKYLPDLILLTITMPPEGSLAVCRALKANQATAAIPVIFLTSGSQPEQVIEAFSTGGCDFIVKPFTEQEALARVDVQLRLCRAEEELCIKNAQLQELNKELADLSRLDPLTKVLNRRSWDQVIIQEHERFQRHGHPYSVLMIDVDQFKAYNDAYGYQMGDDCLCRVADVITSVCRRVDCVGRYGGEGFVVLAPETDVDKAVKLADRIRRAIWGLAICRPAEAGTARVTASVGVSASESTSWEAVLRRAVAALHIAKRAGRNMVYADRGQAGQIGPAATADLSGVLSGQRAGEGNQPSVVLVVDDDPTNRAVCKGYLQRCGYRVREAEDGHAALAAVNKDPPDVIVMDVMMPNMDGLECTRQLRANPDTRDIPIIIVSALARTEDILAGLEAGADEYLAKPIRGSELTLRVQSMARLHRERMDLLMSYEERGSQMRILTRLVEFCRAVSVCEHYEEVLKHSTAAVADVVNCRRVSIMVPDENEGVLRIASSLGLDEALARTLKVPPGRPIAGQVYATGQPIVVNNPEEFQDTIKEYDSPFFASIPLVYVPLDAAGRVVGVLNATEKAGGVPFEARDLEYIELISKVTGTAIHDIRMREARDQASDSIVRALAKLAEYRDNDTGRHLERVTRFCLILAETLREKEKFRDQIDQDFLYRLERSVPLHDIGKVAVPDEILLFPGKLSPEQIAIMRTHAEVGANTIHSLIARAPGIGFLGMAVEIARHHHERYDGKGYPAGLSGDSIPLAARISSVADVYDALTTTRPYKEAYSHETAVKIIQDGRGTQFDPDVVEAFLQRENSFAELAEVMKDPALPEQRSVQEEPVLSTM